MKKTFLLSLALMLSALASVAATNAMDILNQAAAKFKDAPSVSASYTLMSGGEKVSGRVSFSGDRFTMTSPEILTWYDGTTQWTYNKANNEVTVSEPTPDELGQINPFTVINQFRNTYTAKELQAPTGFKKIELTAKNPKAEITTAIVTFNDKSMLPSQINITMRSKQQISIVLSSVTTGKKYNIKAFQFHAPNYPGVQIVDLR
ncbi:MAG: outer-membrane lipoprotein carrier protein LolA [Firmicutes bacterium]|nr:outer-membrane lipoprotein carrier protein LolA [Bacillota bacterium]MCM1401551.1 outer-membrane lipoprotein carrier protein LolA [Bacteroides sp.]MCM1476597.1 outer-membrane lipoprotein carrier protein LolA [Bacteroides sp.]